MFIKKSECELSIDAQHKRILESLASQFNRHSKANGFGNFEFITSIKSRVPDLDKLLIKIRNALQDSDWNMGPPYRSQEFQDGEGQLTIRFNYD